MVQSTCTIAFAFRGKLNDESPGYNGACRFGDLLTQLHKNWAKKRKTIARRILLQESLKEDLFPAV